MRLAWHQVPGWACFCSQGSALNCLSRLVGVPASSRTSARMRLVLVRALGRLRGFACVASGERSPDVPVCVRLMIWRLSESKKGC